MKEKEVFDIEEEMKTEEMRSSVRKYAILAVIAVLIAFAVVGCWSLYASQQKSYRQDVTSQYLSALQKMEHWLDDPQAQASQPIDPLLTSFRQLATSKDEGVSSLSRLYMGDVLSRSHHPKDALAQWAALENDSKADPFMRDMASFLWCQRQLDDGDIPVLRSRLLLLESKNSLWKGPVLEALSVLDIRQGHQHEAVQKLSQLLEMPNIAPGVRYRAQRLVQTLSP